MPSKELVTLTFGDQAENHHTMEKLGKLVDVGQGFNTSDLMEIVSKYPDNCVLTFLDTSVDVEGLPHASVLVIRDGVNLLCGTETHQELLREQLALDWDKKALMYGQIRNKHARWNLCYDDYNQEPDIANGKGRVCSYGDLPHLAKLREKIAAEFGPKATDLKCEGNYYYDVGKCGIGYHGDAERRKVIGVRLGTSLPIYYQWYHLGKPVGDRIEIPLEGGDIYVMSEKAVGTDWKKKKVPTLRHAVGSDKFVKVVV